MRIVNIHYTGFGGLATVINGLVTAPGAQVHEWVMGYYGVAPLDPSHAAFCAARGLRHATFRPLPRRPWAAWRALARWLEAERPDVVLCHSSTAIPSCAWYAKRRRVPLIAVEHTPNEVKSRTEWAGSHAAMFLADRVVVLNDICIDLIRAGLGRAFRPQKVRKIPNGIDPTLFHPRSEIPQSGLLRAGMGARFAHAKRQDVLIDSLFGLDIGLDLAGDGECMAALQARAAAKSGPPVQFRGLIPASDMPAWLRGLDLYLHASEGETVSMSVLQAMATGLPIVASDISGMDETLGRDGRCGILVPNTVQAWRGAIERLASDPGLRAKMGQAARERAIAYYSTEAMLKGYLGIIDELLGSSHRR